MAIACKHLITAGCSFTAGGIGGKPPINDQNDGGCSFLPDPDYQCSVPLKWPDFLSLALEPTSLTNVAADSHGNLATAYTVKSLLEKYHYEPQNTLIIFNLTDPARFDIPCHGLSEKRSSRITWPHEILNFSFWERSSLDEKNKKEESGFQRLEGIHVGYDVLENYTSSFFDMFLHWLSMNHYEFYFMVMTDSILQHEYFSKIIKKFHQHFIEMPGATGMMEYCLKINETVSKTDWHPSTKGHEYIADVVYDFLKKRNLWSETITNG